MAQATLKIAGDSDKAQDAIVALEKKLDNLQGKLKQVHRQKPVKQSSLSSLATYAGSFISVAAAIDVAAKAFMHFEKIKKDSAQKQRPAAAKLAALGQVADKNESLHDLVSQARKAFGEGSFQDVGEAADLVRALKSASIPKGEERQLFIDMATSLIVDDAGVFASASAALQSAVGKIETGNFAAITSKAFAASADSPTTAVELLNASTDSGGATSRLGLSDEELLAAVAVTSVSAGGAAKGGTQMKNLLAMLDKKGGFKDQSLMDSLKQIQGMGMEGAELSKFFGTTEALAGYDTLLKNAEKYEQILKKIHKAEKDSLVRRMISLPGTIPEIAAAHAAMKQENKLENVRVFEGTMQNMRQAAETQLVVSAESKQGGSLGRGWLNWVSGFTSSDQAFLNSDKVQSTLQQDNPQLLQSINGAMLNVRGDDINRRQLAAGAEDFAMPPSLSRAEIQRRAEVAEKTLKVLESIDKKTKAPSREFNRNGR